MRLRSAPSAAAEVKRWFAGGLKDADLVLGAAASVPMPVPSLLRDRAHLPTLLAFTNACPYRR